jgi:hypothetical protein
MRATVHYQRLRGNYKPAAFGTVNLGRVLHGRTMTLINPNSENKEAGLPEYYPAGAR